ncbi:DUF4148 domain-containing protein [Pollutimonas bauzanensis]|uniref:DUF4148 domain-containing protein n=1 Tax=Pollutimonas bauzanensis TaxID=658167 RepID=UPI0033419C9F
MTRTHASAIALAFATLFAGQAMAADTGSPITRAQVSVELAEAIRTGNVIAGESSTKLNEEFPHNYPAQRVSSTVTRAQVQAERAEAIRTGNIMVGESGAKLNEVFPHDYYAQQSVASTSREQVQAELAEAIRSGQVGAHIEA